MQAEIFRRFCEYAHEKAGIALGPRKEAFVAARVGKRVRALGLADEAEYLRYLEEANHSDELVHFLDVISTNHTSFFREAEHFELLRTIVKGWQAEGRQRLRMWSAASSTGEEPYSIVMTVRDVVDVSGFDFKLLATDISTRVLADAQAGRYADDKIASIPRALVARFFHRPESAGGLYEASPALKADVTFRRLNLSQPPFPMRGPFDVVFCRNVLMYFDQAVRQRLLSAIESLLRPGGWLFIGHAETLAGIRSGFQVLRPSIFRLPALPSQA